VGLALKVVQTAAVLEVVHSAVGLVRSPVGITGGGPAAPRRELRDNEQEIAALLEVVHSTVGPTATATA